MTFEDGARVECHASVEIKVGRVIPTNNKGMTKIKMDNGRYWESASETFFLVEKNPLPANNTTEDLFRLCIS